MKRWILLLAALLAPPGRAELEVAATLPDFASIAGAVGGSAVKVTAIARGTEDAHFVDARPSFVRVLNRADVLIEGGADLEAGWLPALVNAARNSKILGSSPGRLVLARHLDLLDVPAGPVDRSMGDVHSGGNPHFWLDPLNGKKIAEVTAQTFIRLDPANAAVYESNLRVFLARLEAKLPEWEQRMAPARGVKVLTYHKSFDYFARRYGLEIAAQLEPKPGIEPSAVHINTLLHDANARAAKLILIEPFRPRKTAEQVAAKLGAKLVIVPEKVNGAPEAKDYFSLFDHLVSKIAGALSPAP